jgi:hypothetical protein
MIGRVVKIFEVKTSRFSSIRPYNSGLQISSEIRENLRGLICIICESLSCMWRQSLLDAQRIQRRRSFDFIHRADHRGYRDIPLRRITDG